MPRCKSWISKEKGTYSKTLGLNEPGVVFLEKHALLVDKLKPTVPASTKTPSFCFTLVQQRRVWLVHHIKIENKYINF